MKTCICNLLIVLAIISASGSLAGVDAFQTHRRLVRSAVENSIDNDDGSFFLFDAAFGHEKGQTTRC